MSSDLFETIASRHYLLVLNVSYMSILQFYLLTSNESYDLLENITSHDGFDKYDASDEKLGNIVTQTMKNFKVENIIEHET